MIAAHELGLALLLPSIRLVGEGNERFAPQETHYQPPFDGASTLASRFGLLYDTTHAIEALHPRLMTLRRLPASKDRPRTVALRACVGSTAATTACSRKLAPAGSRVGFDQLLADWRRTIANVTTSTNTAGQ
eukprot:370276-Prymnesium_polylepis.1